MKRLNILLLFSLSLLWILNSCGISADNPESMLREAGLKVEDYEVVSQGDNLDRGASAWDGFDYEIKFKDDPKELKAQLDKLVATNEFWSLQDGLYVYSRFEESWDLVIHVNLQQSQINIDYSVYNYYS